MKRKMIYIYSVIICLIISNCMISSENDEEKLLSFVKKTVESNKKSEFVNQNKKLITNKVVSQSFYKPLCDEYQCYGGAGLIGEKNNKRYSYIEFKYMNTHFLFAGYHNNDRKLVIQDVLIFESLNIDQAVVCGICRKNEVFDKKIVAVVKQDDSEYYTNIMSSYSFNIEDGKFILISNQGISCENIGYGE